MNNDKQYYNNIAPTRFKLFSAGANTALSIEFGQPEGYDGQYDLSKTMFLTPENNERNLSELSQLGLVIEDMPAELTPNAVLNLKIKRPPTVVVHDTGKKYPAVYINDGGYYKVFDNRK